MYIISYNFCQIPATPDKFILKGEKKISILKDEEKEKAFTTAISGVKSNIIDSYAATRSIRAPCALKHDIKIRILIDIRLSIAPCRALVIVQLPYWLGFRRSITDCLYVQSQDACKISSMHSFSSPINEADYTINPWF